jgi:hypothetical protein
LLRKNVSGIMMTLLLVSLSTLVSDIKPVMSKENNWWNSNWTYRRQINIAENSGYSLTNFPVEVSFMHEGHVQADGRDIRVIDNNSEIPYYMTELNNTVATLIFEINATASSTKTVYIYYGNPTAPLPNYPLVPLTISEGNTGYAIIDNSVYIGWNYTSWGCSNPVELWDDFRIDFNKNNNPTDDNDLIRDYGTRHGGIGRHRRDIEAIGLGEYRGYVRTPIYVDITFADATLRVYRNHHWVETTQADFLFMFSTSYNYANYGGGTEQNIVDGEGTNRPEQWNVLYLSKENPLWMAFRDDSSGCVFASTGLRIGSDYAYVQSAKEISDWDRVIDYSNHTRYDPLDPYDQPPDCRIYWYGDNSNDYSRIEIMAQIFNNQPSIVVGVEETSSMLYWLSLNTFKNDLPIVANITLFDENGTIMETVYNVSTYNFLLPYGAYCVQASIFHNDFTYTSERIRVTLTNYTTLAINFLFGNLTVSCLDIVNRPLQNCTVIFTRQNEKRIGYTDGLGLTSLEAYYGNWTVRAYWMGVLVGEANIDVNQSKIDRSISCKVGDFTVIVFDQYGHPIEANVTLRNEIHDLTYSGYIRKPLENMTFTQIPLIDYNLTIKDDFGTQTYLINTEQTNQIRIETIPLAQKIIYVIIGAVAGIVIGSTGVWIVTKRKRKQ